jgi:hypothetical protein
MVAIFQLVYLREPTQVDIEQQLHINAKRGFLGMFASLDCMQYIWKNCPILVGKANS